MIELDLRRVNTEQLEKVYKDRLQKEIPLSRFTAARIGGNAQMLFEASNKHELEDIVELCWETDIPFTLLGGGSNLLVSDAGIRGLVVLNRARQVSFEEDAIPLQVWAESGANLGVIARMAAQHGFSGLEWAAGIPGTLGGAVFGNAGAHGSDMTGNLLLAEILHRSHSGYGARSGIEEWPVDRFRYEYRSSILKRQHGEGVILSAALKLERSVPELVQAKIDEFTVYRRRTQPPGASMGSMFKNPPGDHAGRLIEAAGLKGLRIGDAQISTLHANFFINLGQAKAVDVSRLIEITRRKVHEKFGVDLELEIEFVGDW